MAIKRTGNFIISRLVWERHMGSRYRADFTALFFIFCLKIYRIREVTSRGGGDILSVVVKNVVFLDSCKCTTACRLKWPSIGLEVVTRATFSKSAFTIRYRIPSVFGQNISDVFETFFSVNTTCGPTGH